MHATMNSMVEAFAAETKDQSEWRLSGWAFVPSETICSARLELDGKRLAPITYGWPRPDVLTAFASLCGTEHVGFTCHVFMPAGLEAGQHTVDLVFLDAQEQVIGRLQQALTLDSEIKRCQAVGNAPEIQGDRPQRRYLDLLEKTLLGLPYAHGQQAVLRRDGRDWPDFAHSMIGLDRLRHLRACAETALRENIPGDFIETGVWRGGACIMLRGVLEAYGDTSRRVWVADSFAGLPKPNPEKYPADAGDTLHAFTQLAISLEQVQENFRRYGLLDQQVKFLKGLFSNTLATAPVNQLAVLRLDGDMYESTMDALTALYPKLASGGFCVIDDYGAIKACRQAVNDYRAMQGIDAPISMIDWTGAWWRKA